MNDEFLVDHDAPITNEWLNDWLTDTGFGNPIRIRGQLELHLGRRKATLVYARHIMDKGDEIWSRSIATQGDVVNLINALDI